MGMLVCAAVLVFKTALFVHSSTAATGRVVELQWHRDLPAPRGVSPGGAVIVFTFTDNSGRAHTVHSAGAVSPAPFRVGDAVTVLFPPKKPEQARIQSFRMLWFVPTVLSLLGSVFAAVSGLIYFANRKAEATTGP